MARPRWMGDSLPRGSSRVAFWLLFALILLCYAALTYQQVNYGIEFDEGFNLTVVRNLATGNGYSTTGIVQWTWQIPFDPNASTGPALLLPASLVWFMTDGTLWLVRLVPMTLFLGYAMTLAVLFWRTAGPWAGLAAASSPLVLSVSRSDLSTVSLVPGRMIGEFAGVAFLGLMVYALDRRRPLTGGLMAGLAILTKINFGLPVVTVFLVWILMCWIRKVSPLAIVVAKLLAGLVIAPVGFELFRLASVGITNYLPNLKAQVAWMLVAVDGPSWREHLLTGGRRSGELLQTMSVTGILALLIALCLILAFTFGFANQRQNAEVDLLPRATKPTALSPSVMLLTAGLSIALWWGFVPPEKLPRIGIPIILLVSPVILSGGVIAMQFLLSSISGRARLVYMFVSASLIVGAAAALVVQTLGALANDFGARMLTEQKAAAAVIQESGTESLPMDWIWNLAEFQILSGIPSETKPEVPPPTILVFNAIRARSDAGVDDARMLVSNCSAVLYSSQNALVCKGQS